MSAPYTLAADDAAVLPHIISALNAKPAGPGRYTFRCPLPNHGKGNGDQNPSAVLTAAPNFPVNCFAGCDPKELWAAAIKPHKPAPAAAADLDPIAVYPAPRDDSGRPAVKVYRIDCAGPACNYRGCNGKDDKHIWQKPKTGGRKGYPVLLWGDKAGNDGPVVVVEGEKAAAAIADAGRVAASYIGGCGMAGKADYSALSGRPIIHWPDNDTQGIKAAHFAAAAIHAAGISADQVILPPVDNSFAKKRSGADAADLPNKKAIRRHIDGGGTAYIPPAAKESAAVDRPADTGFLWGPIARLAPPRPEPPPLPLDRLPPIVKEAISAACILARGSSGIAALCALGSISAAAHQDFNVEILAPNPAGAPLSLFTFGISESGWRKSTLNSLFYQPHFAADKTLKGKWTAAQKGQGDLDTPPEDADKPVNRSPGRIKTDATVESITACLASSQTALTLANADAAAVIQNWSGQPAQMSKTLAAYAELWDGGNIAEERINRGSATVTDGRLTLHYLTQSGIGLDFILGDKAVNGFAARCLLHQDFKRPDGPETVNAADLPEKLLYRQIERLTDLIRTARERQDTGSQFVKKGTAAPFRPAITLSAAARQQLVDFNADMESRADHSLIKGNLILQSWQVRAAENAARIAGNLAAVAAYAAHSDPHTPPPPPEIDGELMDTGIMLAEYYHNALACIAGQTELAEPSTAAGDVETLLTLSWDKRDDTHQKYWRPDGAVKLNSLLAQNANGYHGKKLRRDIEFRQRIIQLLVDQGHIQPEYLKGYYAVHPDIRAGIL